MAAGNLSIEQLEADVAARETDTVIIAFTDMQGRLVGKRASARLFLEELAEHGAECCNYLLAVDVEMNTVDGYAHLQLGARLRRHGDDTRPSTPCARIPWLPGTAMVTADLAWLDGTPVNPDPRQILKRQLARLAERGPRGATSAPNSSSSSSRTATGMPGRKGYDGPHPGERLQHRLRPAGLDAAWSRCCATSATAWTAPACTARASRASATSVSRRSRSATPMPSPPATTTRSTRTGPRRSPTSTARR